MYEEKMTTPVIGNNTRERRASIPPLSQRNTPKCFHKQRTNSGLKGTKGAKKIRREILEDRTTHATQHSKCLFFTLFFVLTV